MRLLLSEIVDPAARENFQKLDQYLVTENVLTSGFKHFELTFTQAETNKRIPHRLGYLPKDLIQTRLTGAGSLTWNYTLFTDEFLDVTTTGACVVRFLLGTYGTSGA